MYRTNSCVYNHRLRPDTGVHKDKLSGGRYRFIVVPLQPTESPVIVSFLT